MTTYKEIWDTLSAVNVNDHVEKKNGLSYLSWAWAWGVMMKHYPQTQVLFRTDDGQEDSVKYPAGDGDYTVDVWCRVKIDECVREMWLPVMDYKNKSIINPSSRDVSDARMRCMTKAFALFGLGHYIYAGEDLPSEDSPMRGAADHAARQTVEKAKHFKTSNDALAFVEAALVVVEGFETVSDVNDFLSSNKQQIESLKEEFPKTYGHFKDQVTNVRQALENQ